jgi:hypothetical protein
MLRLAEDAAAEVVTPTAYIERVLGPRVTLVQSGGER